MSESVRLEVRTDRIAVATIDRPGSRANILTADLWNQFDEVLQELEAGLAGLVVASGKPGAFIAGADLKYLASVPAPNDPGVRALIELGLRVLARLSALPFPTCAAINGPALGGGLEVALACDYRAVGSNPKIQIGLPEVKLGLIPGWGGTQRLPRLVGLKPAADLLATGESLNAEQSMKIGLIDIRTDSTHLIEVAADFLAKKSKREPLAINDHTLPMIPREPVAAREAIQCLIAGTKLSFDSAIRVETTAFLRLAGSDESKRLIAEFFNRKT